MKKFYITGTSGVGKSAISLKLNERGVPSIDMDKVEGLCNWVNKEDRKISNWYSGIGRDFFESHDYICDKEKLCALLNGPADILVVVGYADNQSDFIDLFDKIFLFQCDQNTFLKRIENRVDNDFGKHSSEKEVLLDWYNNFETDMLEKGAICIDTMKPLDIVVEEVMKYINI